MNTTLKFAVGSLIGATAISFSLGALAQDITGAGASFPAPIYAKWADAEYQKATNNRVNYQSIGSGGRHQAD
jgi:phosphate transport system substrate-binding protein